MIVTGRLAALSLVSALRARVSGRCVSVPPKLSTRSSSPRPVNVPERSPPTLIISNCWKFAQDERVDQRNPQRGVEAYVAVIWSAVTRHRFDMSRSDAVTPSAVPVYSQLTTYYISTLSRSAACLLSTHYQQLSREARRPPFHLFTCRRSASGGLNPSPFSRSAAYYISTISRSAPPAVPQLLADQLPIASF